MEIADDDDAILVHDDWLPEPVLPNGCGYSIDGGIVEPWVVLVGTDGVDLTHINLHSCLHLVRDRTRSPILSHAKTARQIDSSELQRVRGIPQNRAGISLMCLAMLR